MATSGAKVTSLQPMAQNKVMSVEMKKKDQLKGCCEGGIMIVINWVWVAEEKDNNVWLLDLQLVTGWMVCHSLSCGRRKWLKGHWSSYGELAAGI